MRRLALAGALAVLAAGCATAPPPPREISEAVDGATVTLALRQELVVVLSGDQATGFRWDLTRAAAPTLTQVGEATHQQRATDARLAGAGGVTTFRFRAAAAGNASIAFAYRRPWEVNMPPVKTVRFDIKVE
jgi:inhibitor of cysteine peptidase